MHYNYCESEIHTISCGGLRPYITTWPSEYAIYMVHAVISISANIYDQLVPVRASPFLLLDMSPSFDLVEFLVLKSVLCSNMVLEMIYHIFSE
jgi:hypothetical protein